PFQRPLACFAASVDAEEIFDVRRRELLGSALIGFEHGGDQVLLARLELGDLLLDGSGGYQAVDGNDLLLPNAVCAVGGLVFHGGVPPGIEVNDRVGGGQVETAAAGLQTDQEDRNGGVGLEAIDALRAILGAAVQVLVA